jgi:hypothetical protein
MRRDAHTKTHGCVKAEFTVLPDIPEAARLGLFKTPATYATWIRFSNAFSSIASDQDIDVRGMAIKVMGVEGPKLLEREQHEKTQDFLLINHNVFFSPDTKTYLEFSREYVKRESTIGYLLRPDRWRQAATLYRAARGKMTNPLTSRYWSSVPFALGTAAIKYSAAPCGGTLTEGRLGSSANALREAMAAHLAAREACFDFMVQFQIDPVTMPVEDSSIEWDERVSPFIKVARIRIPPQTFDSPLQMQYAENLSFTPWHSLPEHRPIGGVNRIRKSVYEQISTLRHTANRVPRREPAAFEEFA